MESTKIVTKLDFKTLKYCNLFMMKYRKKTYLFYIIIAILSLAIAIADILHFKTIYLAILSGLYIIYLVYQILTIERKLDQTLTRFFSKHNVTTQTTEISEEKIILYRGKDINEPIEFDWSFITEILEMPQYYMLMAGKTPIIVDRSDEAVIEGNQDSLTAIVNEKAKMKPHKKVDFDIVKTPITFVHQELPPEDAVEVDNVVVDDAESEDIINDNQEQIPESENKDAD